jgi:integrase
MAGRGAHAERAPVSDVGVGAQLGHANANVTRAIYAHVFDRTAAHERGRQAFESVEVGALIIGRAV